MKADVYIYILVSAAVSFLIRAVPLTLIRGRITSPFLRSFVCCVAYLTQVVMTFHAIIEATAVPFAGVLALIAGIAAAYKGISMFKVAIICCVIVFTVEQAAPYLGL